MVPYDPIFFSSSSFSLRLTIVDNIVDNIFARSSYPGQHAEVEKRGGGGGGGG